MPRKKSLKEWERATYVLEKETRHKIKKIAEFENMSQSELISFLVHNWDIGIDPNEKLNSLLKEREELNQKLTKLDMEIKQHMGYIKYYNELQKQKQGKKEQAIKIISRKLLHKEFEEAERLSKVWQRISGVSSLELLKESMDLVNNKGI